MDTQYIISELKKNKQIFKTLLENLNKEVYLWKKSEDKWCLLEIVCHLYDEERDDFRMRVKTTLESPGKQPPPIAPAEWVKSRKYIEQDYNKKLEEFLQERDNSIAYLEGLQNPEWSRSFTHREFGELTAKMFFINWLAHDYLHIRQIIKLKYDYLSETTGETLLYAGEW